MGKKKKNRVFVSVSKLTFRIFIARVIKKVNDNKNCKLIAGNEKKFQTEK